MSWSLSNQCFGCAVLNEGCTDQTFIAAAINAIHSLPSHKGAGTVTMECCNHRPLQAEKKEDK